ncbi:MAG: sigma-E processing peptidase SpoIIGA [Oscillospiraceae bacterium]
MKKTIYIDILIVLNFIITYFLITISVKLSDQKVNKKRCALGSLVGSLFSLIILETTLSFLLINTYKLFLSSIIVLLSFKINNFKNFIKNTLIFYTVSFLFGGIMVGVWLMLMPQNMIMHNGVVYFNYSILGLLFLTTLVYFILNIIVDVYGRNIIKNTSYDVEIHIKDKVIKSKGFLDTGNILKDMHTGKLVVVSSFNVINKYLKKDIKIYLENYFNNKTEDIKNNVDIRFIPFNSVGIQGVLPAINVNKIIIKGEKGKLIKENLLLAISKQDVLNGQYDFLLNALLFD